MSIINYYGLIIEDHDFSELKTYYFNGEEIPGYCNASADKICIFRRKNDTDLKL